MDLVERSDQSSDEEAREGRMDAETSETDGRMERRMADMTKMMMAETTKMMMAEMSRMMTANMTETNKMMTATTANTTEIMNNMMTEMRSEISQLSREIEILHDADKVQQIDIAPFAVSDCSNRREFGPSRGLSTAPHSLNTGRAFPLEEQVGLTTNLESSGHLSIEMEESNVFEPELRRSLRLRGRERIDYSRPIRAGSNLYSAPPEQLLVTKESARNERNLSLLDGSLGKDPITSVATSCRPGNHAIPGGIQSTSSGVSVPVVGGLSFPRGPFSRGNSQLLEREDVGPAGLTKRDNPAVRERHSPGKVSETWNTQRVAPPNKGAPNERKGVALAGVTSQRTASGVRTYTNIWYNGNTNYNQTLVEDFVIICS